MKRLFYFLGALLIGLNCPAENTIQMTPFKTTAGVASNKSNVINIELANSDDIWAIQFFLYLPEGMSLPVKSNGSLYTTLTDRTYDEEEEEDVLTCASSYNSSGNYYTIMFYTATTNVIKKGSGSILTIRYTTESTMADGVYPVIIKSTKIETGEHVQSTTPETSSYVVIGDAMPEHIDLSGMTGYVPSFVVNQLNSDLSANTKSLNLSGVKYEDLGADIVMPDGSDMLWYTSDKAALNRTFAAEKWSTLCLPFTLQASALSGTPTIKVMESYDDSDASITLSDATTLEKGKPYMVRCASETKLINNVSISDPEPVGNEPGSVNSGKLTMKGTYQGTTVSSTAAKTYYGFSNDKFVGVNVGGSGRVKPFRAYLEYEGAAGTRSIGLGDDNGTTAIEKIADDGEADSPLYNLQGMRIEGTPRTKGVYLRNGKKQIIK